MSLSKNILNLQKQNDSIYNSLIAKNIEINFKKIGIIDEINPEEYFELLNTENTRLKELAKANKPVSQPKEIKLKVEEQKNTDKKDKNIEINVEDNEEYIEPVKKFDTLTNMEDMKRSFFSGDYTIFEEHLKSHPFKLYNVKYKYDSDKDNAPEFSAKNLLKGFVRNFDDYRKYFMICFRCYKHQNKNQDKNQDKYKYVSFWIVNTNEQIQNIIGSLWEDFEFEETTDLNKFINNIKKTVSNNVDLLDDYSYLSESYVH